MTTLLFLQPGHFHAALTLKSNNARVSPDVYVYASPGPELDAFVSLVESFNTRDEAPTNWRLHVRTGDDPLDVLVDERKGELVVLAGRNDTKLATIARLHGAGFNVLADKPWLIDSASLEHLSAITQGLPLAMDIMTSRHDTFAKLRKRLTASAELFGEFMRHPDGPPAIELESIHHLLKVVNGEPLRRRPWYFDTRVQGDGLTDIQSHMADQAQWLLDGQAPDASFECAVHIESARLWPTAVPLGLYSDITGEPSFAEALIDRIQGDVLQLAANGELIYSLSGIRVLQRAEWRQREPAGSGDSQSAVVRGSRATVRMTQGPETGFKVAMDIAPHGDDAGFERVLGQALAQWQGEYPGLKYARLDADEPAFRLQVPEALCTGHEAHFAMVLDECLDAVEQATWQPELARRIRLRYTLLGRARDKALSKI